MKENILLKTKAGINETLKTVQKNVLRKYDFKMY